MSPTPKLRILYKCGTIISMFLTFSAEVIDAADTRCAIDPAFPATKAGNSYWCPEEDADGNPNPYTSCCYDDRPNADGNYHNCCQGDDARDEEKKEQFKTVGIIVGISCAGAIFLVFVIWYCRADTFKFIGTAKNRMKYWLDLLLDSICFCSCCCEQCRRTEHTDAAESKSGNAGTTAKEPEEVVTMEW